MLVGIEVTKPGDDIARQTDADNLEDCGEDENDQGAKRRMGFVRNRVLESGKWVFVGILGQVQETKGRRTREVRLRHGECMLAWAPVQTLVDVGDLAGFWDG